MKRLPMQRVRRIPPISGLPYALHSAQPPLGYIEACCGHQRCGHQRGKHKRPPMICHKACRHAKQSPRWQDATHGHRVHGVVVAQPTASRTKNRERGEGTGGESGAHFSATSGARKPATSRHQLATSAEGPADSSTFCHAICTALCSAPPGD